MSQIKLVICINRCLQWWGSRLCKLYLQIVWAFETFIRLWVNILCMVGRLKMQRTIVWREIERERAEINVYEHTSHLFNMKIWFYVVLSLIRLKLTSSKVCECCSVCFLVSHNLAIRFTQQNPCCTNKTTMSRMPENGSKIKLPLLDLVAVIGIACLLIS